MKREALSEGRCLIRGCFPSLPEALKGVCWLAEQHGLLEFSACKTIDGWAIVMLTDPLEAAYEEAS